MVVLIALCTVDLMDGQLASEVGERGSVTGRLLCLSISNYPQGVVPKLMGNWH